MFTKYRSFLTKDQTGGTKSDLQKINTVVKGPATNPNLQPSLFKSMNKVLTTLYQENNSQYRSGKSENEFIP